MPRAREVKNRIANVKDIRQITKAMNAIAMARLTRMKNRLSQARAYHREMENALQPFARDWEECRNPLVAPPAAEEEEEGKGKTGVMVLNSDRGLCGRYKEELNRATRDFIRSRQEPVALIAGGEKAHSYFHRWDELVHSWTKLYDEPEYEDARLMAEDVLERVRSGQLREFWLVYMEYYSDLNQELRVEQVIPLSRPEGEKEEGEEEDGETPELEEEEGEGRRDERELYVLEPSREEILDEFLVSYFKEKIFWSVLQTKTSEQAIRRRAMRDATENADELVDELTLTYNKARQQQITREINDIMGGAEALREE